MRITIRMRNSENIKTNKALSKFNFSSRRNYLIDTVLLEKYLMYNTSIKSRDLYIYNTMDLEMCYNRQIPKVSGLMQEAVGVNR